jgi:hypothetical protein
MELKKGQVRKMHSKLEDEVKYQLPLSGELVDMNALIGRKILMKFDGEILCIACGKQTKKSFGQGFCYNCFISAPESAECIIRPELCRAHLGEGRDPEWEEKHHNRPHYVYLALSSAIKVGITRDDQIPTRWIDQGASSGIIVAKTPNRYLSGMLEVALKSEFTDKTNWRKMLKNEVLEDVDLEETKWELEQVLPRDLREYMLEDDEIIDINYPVLKYPEKVKSVSFEKLAEIGGTLAGIKGQYLIFDDETVINMRKHTGFVVSLEADVDGNDKEQMSLF